MTDEHNSRFYWTKKQITITPPKTKAAALDAAPETVPHVPTVTETDLARWEAMYQDIENEVERGKS